MRLKLHAGLLLIVVMVAGRAAGAAMPAAVYRISGVVVSVRDGAPVPYCRVSAAPANGSPAASRGMNAGDRMRGMRPAGGPPGRGDRAGAADAGQGGRLETKADATGHFALELPQAGAWQVRAESRGFRSQLYDEHEGYFSSIVLTEAEPAHEVTFRLTPDAAIDGLVMDEAGDPVARGQVVAELLPELAGAAAGASGAKPRQVAVTQTDDRGRYELADLGPGNYRVRVQAQPWYAAGSRGVVTRGTAQAGSATALDASLDVVFQTTWYPAATSEGEAETIVLHGGEERQADFQLTAIAAAHLVVTRPEMPEAEAQDGRARQGMPMSVTRVDADGQFGQTSFISGNAREWDFGNLAPGTYEVRLPAARGEQDGEVRQIEVRPGSSVVTLDSSTPLTSVKLLLDGTEGRPSVVFTDVMTGRRINSNQPQRLRMGRGGDAEGNETVGHELTMMLSPGRYQVSLEGAGQAYVASITGTGARVSRTMVEIGSTAATLTLHMASGRGEVSGGVRMGGKADAGAMILLVPVTLGEAGDASEIVRDQSNSDGSYRLRSVVPGRYILVAVDRGWETDWRAPGELTKLLAQGVPVELKAGDARHQDLAAVTP